MRNALAALLMLAGAASAELDLSFSGLRRLFDGSGRPPEANASAVEAGRGARERVAPAAPAALPKAAATLPPLPRFPRGFFFGAATAAHQVEGDNRDSDWWEFERRRAEREGTDVSGRADDRWNLWREDFALAKRLGHTAHRFSIEWARVEPRQGEFDERALEHYRRELAELSRLKIEPLVTLHHFTNPKWFSDGGGWEREDAPALFARYVEFVVSRLGGRARIWLPINEPTVLLHKGWIQGEWPPEKRDFIALLRAGRNLLAAHRAAYDAIKRVSTDARVGFIVASSAYRPRHAWNPLDVAASRLVRFAANDLLLAGARGAYDFIGLNYYRGFAVSAVPPGLTDLGDEKSDVGWGIYPEGLRQVLHELAAEGKPIVITENGLADAADARRGRFILDHLREVRRAMDEGVDVRGYLHWSLLDNYEWTDGFGPRFGLAEVDYATETRTARPSAEVLRDVIRASRASSSGKAWGGASRGPGEASGSASERRPSPWDGPSRSPRPTPPREMPDRRPRRRRG